MALTRFSGPRQAEVDQCGDDGETGQDCHILSDGDRLEYAMIAKLLSRIQRGPIYHADYANLPSPNPSISIGVAFACVGAR